MDDMSTGGHEANKDNVPLIGCTDMGVSKDFWFSNKIMVKQNFWFSNKINYEKTCDR